MRISGTVASLIGIIILGIFVFAGVSAINDSFRVGVGNFFNGIGRWFAPETSASVLSSQTLLTRMQPMGQLVSTSAQFAKADITVSVFGGAWGRCQHAASYVAEVDISAGVDLYEITPEDVSFNEETQTYTLRVPSPVLTACSVSKIDEYDRPTRPGVGCTVNWDDLRQIAQYSALTQIRDEALEGGFLVTAERDTRVALAAFVGALTQKDVIVQFIPPEGTDNVPTSLDARRNCDPAIPANWNYDASSNNWLKN